MIAMVIWLFKALLAIGIFISTISIIGCFFNWLGEVLTPATKSAPILEERELTEEEEIKWERAKRDMEVEEMMMRADREAYKNNSEW